MHEIEVVIVKSPFETILYRESLRVRISAKLRAEFDRKGENRSPTFEMQCEIFSVRF